MDQIRKSYLLIKSIHDQLGGSLKKIISYFPSRRYRGTVTGSGGTQGCAYGRLCYLLHTCVTGPGEASGCQDKFHHAAGALPGRCWHRGAHRPLPSHVGSLSQVLFWLRNLLISREGWGGSASIFIFWTEKT